MLPRFKTGRKPIILTIIVSLILLAALAILIDRAQANEDDDIVLVTILNEETTTYLISGTIIADEVEVTFEFARRRHILTFGATGGTVHFESSLAGTAVDILIGVTARARTGESWRPLTVMLMSFANATPIPSITLPAATVTPTRPAPTATVRATRQPIPTATATATATPQRHGTQRTYLPHIINQHSSGE